MVPMKTVSLPILNSETAASTLELPRGSQWEAIFEAMEDGVCVQAMDTRILWVNHAFAEMIGVPVQELIGRTCSAVFGCSTEQNQHMQPCARQLSYQTGHAMTEELDGRNPGQRLRARISPVREANGEVSAYVMVVRDVTEITLREREQARIEQIARLGEMVAGLAHEIKNPLAGIKGAVDILIERRNPADSERKVLEDVRHEVNRINDAMQALLNRARPRNFNIQPGSLTDAVKRAIGLGRAIATSTAHGQIQVDYLPPSEPITIPLDATQIEDAVLNLILNALEAIEGTGLITIQVVSDNTHNAHEPFATILVSDTGRGIPADNLQRIFHPFYTTNPHGTGLGLPAVRRIVRAHGGRVEVTSTVGVGTTFKLSLPYRPQTQGSNR